MRFRALFLIVCAALVVASTTLSASAQSVVLGAVIERRADRPLGVDSRTINWDDCQADDALEVVMSLTNPTGLSLEIWAGTTNCDSDAVRQSPSYVPDLCWQVAKMEVAVSSAVALAVRDIMPHDDTGAGTGLADACNTAAASRFPMGALTLFFILTNGNVTAGAGATLPLRYDLRGPAAPTLNSVAQGDAQLWLSWSPGPDVDLQRYQLYCEPADSADRELCTASTLALPSASPRGQASQSATSGVAEGLNNGVRYACGLAGFDTFGNAGPLSNLVCAVPKVGAGPELTGRCQLGRAPLTPGTSLAVLTLLGCLAWRHTKRKRAARANPNRALST